MRESSLVCIRRTVPYCTLLISSSISKPPQEIITGSTPILIPFFLGKHKSNKDNGQDTWNTGSLGNRRRPSSISPDSPSCPMNVSDGCASCKCTGRCDDGSDDSIVSPKLAESAALQGIGKLSAIEPVYVQVSLRSGDRTEYFYLSNFWTSPRTVLNLAASQLPLVNVTYLVEDDKLAFEDVLIGLAVLRAWISALTVWQCYSTERGNEGKNRTGETGQFYTHFQSTV